MKRLLFSFLIIPFFNQAQKIALIDRNFMKPILFTDAITRDSVLKGQFPIFYNDIDAVIKQVNWLIKYIDVEKPVKKEVKNFTMGNSNFITVTEKAGNNNKYHIAFKTRTDNMEFSMDLISEGSKHRTLQKLTIFNDYLQNNNALLKDSVNTR